MDSAYKAMIGPEVIRRACGGYLAITRRSTSLRIGVIADTEIQAVQEFQRLVECWEREREMELAQKTPH